MGKKQVYNPLSGKFDYVIEEDVLTMTTATDPALNAAVTTAIIDAYSGNIITLTAGGNAQTLEDPTDTDAGKKFTVVNHSTSGANTIEVNGITLSATEAQSFIWDGAAWVPITAIDADDIVYTPAGSIIATDVQAAIVEINPNKAAVTKTGTFTGFTSAQSKALDITGVNGNNPTVRQIRLWISNDPGANTNIAFRLGFYSKDTKLEQDMLYWYFDNVTYTETDGIVATDTTDTVDSIAGLVKSSKVRFMGGTAENRRLTVAPSGTTITFEAAGQTHATNSGVVKVSEMIGNLQLNDADASNEIHMKLEFLSAPNASTNVYIELDLQA